MMEKHGFPIEEIDFKDDLEGVVISRAICKDCGNGDHIKCFADVDCCGYTRIWMLCDIHTEGLVCGGNIASPIEGLQKII